MTKNGFRVRSIHWKTMTAKDRLWFIAVCALLALLFIGIALDAAGTIQIPSWVALVWTGLAGFAAYWVSALLDPGEADDDSDDDEDEE